MTLSARELLAKKLRELRAERDWSQEDLAAASGLHRTYIGTIERSEQSITIDNIQKLADAFEVTISELFQE